MSTTTPRHVRRAHPAVRALTRLAIATFVIVGVLMAPSTLIGALVVAAALWALLVFT